MDGTLSSDFVPLGSAAPAEAGGSAPSSSALPGNPSDWAPLPASPPPPPSDADDGMLATAGKALLRGVIESGKAAIQAPTAFRDREPDEQDNSHLGQILATPVSQGWDSPTWWLAHIAHGLGSMAPSLATGIAGGVIGVAAAGGPEDPAAAVTGIAGGAIGIGLGSALTEIAPAYQRARAAGLDHDAAVDRAIKETGIAGAVGTIMGLAPGVKIFGKTAEGALRAPISEALAQIFGVQPTIGAAQQEAVGAVEGKAPTVGELATGYAENVGMGAAIVGVHALVSPRVPATPTVADITAAPDLDTAIATANKVAQGTPVDVASITARADAADASDVEVAQAKLVSLASKIKGATVEQADDGSYHYRITAPDGTEQTVPLKIWNPDAPTNETAEPVATDESGLPTEDQREIKENTITPELGQAIRDHYAGLGFDTVFIQNDPRIPFDGAVDPDHPDTIFLSNDPTRNAEQVAAHEVTHLLSNISTPDGISLADMLHDQVMQGMTAEGRSYAERMFGADAPKRASFPDGPQGDEAHANAVTNFLVTELSADIGGEAPKFQTFLPRVIDAVRERIGDGPARDILDKLLDGIRGAVETIRSFFSGADTDPGARTASQTWVTNLEEIHDTLARMYAARYGDVAEAQAARVGIEQDRAARDQFLASDGKTVPPETPTPEEGHETALGRFEGEGGATGIEPPRGAADIRQIPPEALDEYDDLHGRMMTLRRWLATLDEDRKQRAPNSPQVALLRQTEQGILAKVHGVEARLTGAARDRLANVRGQIADLVAPKTDSPEMAKVRQSMAVVRTKIDALTPDPDNPSIVMSPRVIRFNPEGLNKAQLAALEEVGAVRDIPSARERVEEAMTDFGRKAIQALVDPYIFVKDISAQAYTALRNANTSSGALEAFMKHGTLKFDGSTYRMSAANGGFIHNVVNPLHGEIHRFLWWVAAHRAERLASEDRENLFSQTNIDTLKTLNQSSLPFDYELASGQTTRSREAAYVDTLRKLDVFNKNALDVAAESGLIKRGSINTFFSNPFYVPFYRLADKDAHFAGPSVTKGFVKQHAFKKLEGGTEKLSPDLLQNLIGNWSHMIDASLRNRAASITIDAARLGADPAAVERTAQEVAHMMGKEAKASTVWIMRDGDKHFFQITNPYLYTAISALEFTGYKGHIFDAMTWFKTKLTVGVTASPIFRAKLMVRDSMQAIATAPMSYNMFKNLNDGMAANDFGGAMKNMARAALGQELERLNVSPEYLDALAGGALMRLGTGHDTGARQYRIENGIVLNTEGAINKFWAKIKTFAEAYQEVGGQFEDVNRLALYKSLIAKGVSHDEAAFAGRDLEDFTLKGAGTLTRFLTQTVPFMNAWAQGVYKLGRATGEDYRRVGIVLGATVLVSIGLNAIYADDEDWKQRTEYDRNTNWWFKFGGQAYRIPKGFEIGAIATIAERGAEFFFSKEMNGRRFLNNVESIIFTNMSMSPVPQLFKPIIDVAMNENSATGAPIEREGQSGLLPEYRYGSGNTLAARGVSDILNEGTRAVLGKQAQSLSPAQIDYLVNGYFGWLGAMISHTGDTLLRQVTTEPARPALDPWRLATGGIVADKNSPESRYVDLMYQQGEAYHEAYSTYHALLNLGRTGDAAEFFKSHQADIIKEPYVAKAEQMEAAFNTQIRRIENSDTLSPEKKRIEIMKIDAMKNRSAEQLFGVK